MVQRLYDSLANHGGTSTDVDRPLSEALLQILADSLGVINKTPTDALSLHESIVKLSPNNVKQSLEQRSITSANSKNRITFDDFQNLAMPIYLKTIKKIP